MQYECFCAFFVEDVTPFTAVCILLVTSKGHLSSNTMIVWSVNDCSTVYSSLRYYNASKITLQGCAQKNCKPI